MKITVLNGSPRANGNTATMVQAFEKGATEDSPQLSDVYEFGRRIQE